MSRDDAAALPSQDLASDLRGWGRLAIDGVIGVTDIVEAVHAAVGHLPAMVGRPAPTTTGGVARIVYGSVRGITRVVGGGVDRSLAMLAPVLGDSAPSSQREAVVAALNGVLGDHLEASGNPLAIRMQLRHDGEALALTRRQLSVQLPHATGRLLLQVHGLCMNDRQWNYAGHDHGLALARNLGCTPLQLHYNSGRHVSRNGRDFADMLDRLVKAWPVPVEDITLLCHSMGGLVTRSALDIGFAKRRAWTKLPIRVVFLGTPHHGAPLERAGSWADLLIGISPYSAPFVKLGKMRSAGIQDLRHGNVRDSDWQHANDDARVDMRNPMPLPKTVRAYAVAVTTQQAPPDGDTTRLRGDGLVPIASALGEHADPRFDLRIPRSRRWIGYGINHLELLGSDAVYRRLVGWLKA